jgi:alkanesulfonate monooxygenase SsuD/methylene tetrahydromethanopterin reductase-like flavin-dependent oxidoreductase (luciferase family)
VQFGMQFFPDVSEREKSPAAYYMDAMRLVEYCDVYGYSHVRTVEHYFHYWGGYSPSPLMFLTAISQHTKKAKLITGAVVPAFNHPLKLASEIAMLDGISGGRLEVGFARAFLPQEFRHFGIDIEESVERFEEGIAQVRKLLEEENVTSKGRFHSFSGVTTHPRPTQLPCPPFYVAVVGTPASFERAGRMGYWIMAIPGVGSDPIDGGPIIPTLSSQVLALRAEQQTRSRRTTARTICVVMEGEGFSQIGNEKIDWEVNDVFTLPHWTWANHTAQSKRAIMITISDPKL